MGPRRREGSTCSDIGKVGEHGRAKDPGDGGLLPRTSNTLEKDRKRLRVIHYQLKGKCKSQKFSLAT